MAHPGQNCFAGNVSNIRLSRRAMVSHAAALGFTLSGLTAIRPRAALAALTVRVDPPTIVRGEDCTATVSVLVTISHASPGVRFETHGDILEADDPDGEPDFCCTLLPQATPATAPADYVLLLRNQVMAADLGLVKGIGAASDETYSPDLVELFARVWLRDLSTDREYGPWDSPLRIAVASTARAWTKAGRFPGSELMPPRPRTPRTAIDGAEHSWPPQACVS